MKLITILSSALNNKSINVRRKGTGLVRHFNNCKVVINEDDEGYDIKLTENGSLNQSWDLDPDSDFISIESNL